MTAQTAPTVGDLRVWWIPQVPMPSFNVPVESVEQGRWLCDVLAGYDAFQFDHRVKPDYCNTGGVQRYEDLGDGDIGWFDIDDEDGDV